MVSLGLSLLLIPRYGARGAALSVCGTLLFHTILNQVGLGLHTGVNMFRRTYLKVYGAITFGILGLVLVRWLVAPPLLVLVAATALVSLAVMASSLHLLKMEKTFPELQRIPGLSLLLRLLGHRERSKYHSFQELLTRTCPELFPRTRTILAGSRLRKASPTGVHFVSVPCIG